MQSPDIANFVNLGALALIAAFAVKEFFAYLNKKGSNGGSANGSSVIKVDLGPLHQKLDQLIRTSESTAGAKSSDWWELAFARIVRQCLEDYDSRRSDELEETRKALERAIAMAVAEISRQIRDGR